jgi:hypothetical protein
MEKAKKRKWPPPIGEKGGIATEESGRCQRGKWASPKRKVGIAKEESGRGQRGKLARPKRKVGESKGPTSALPKDQIRRGPKTKRSFRAKAPFHWFCRSLGELSACDHLNILGEGAILRISRISASLAAFAAASAAASSLTDFSIRGSRAAFSSRTNALAL